MPEQFPKAALVTLTLQNGNPIVINAHAVASINIYGSSYVSAIKLTGDDKIYIVKGAPTHIKQLLDQAIN